MTAPRGLADQTHEPYETALAEDVTPVPVASLLSDLSTRVNGPNDEHIRLLAGMDDALPPIIVHRSTMQVIDGMHRLRAAALRGHTDIAVRFYDGSDRDAFVLAVQANIAHGLPLSLADRSAAARRIIRSYPEWSDRRVAAASGLAPRTVSSIRRRTAGGDSEQARIGRDGRVRPLDSAGKRRLTEALIVDNPDASLRQIAREAGVAPSTVRIVRQRMHAGLDPVTERRQHQDEASATKPSIVRSVPRAVPIDRQAALQGLRKDPSVRFNEAGRMLLQWLDSSPHDAESVRRVVSNLPDHCFRTVLALVRENSRAWQDLVHQLEEHPYKPARRRALQS